MTSSGNDALQVTLYVLKGTMFRMVTLEGLMVTVMGGTSIRKEKEQSIMYLLPYYLFSC